MTPTEERALKNAMLDDRTSRPVTLLIVDAWQLASVLRLAASNPSLHSPLTSRLSYVAGLIAGAIINRHPRVKKAFDPGIGRGSFERLARPAMEDTEPLQIEMTTSAVYLVVVALQLITRHPDMADDLRQRLISAGRQFQGSVVEVHPGAASMLERGWNSAYDVEADL